MPRKKNTEEESNSTQSSPRVLMADVPMSEFEPPQISVPIKKKSKKLLLLVSVVVSLCVGASAYFGYSYLNSPEQAANIQEKETKELLEAVGALILLPPGEEPAIFNVQDAALLTTSQPFFSQAQNGDMLLVYAKAGKAILYSKERGVIVNVGPVTFDDTSKALSTP